MCPKKATPAEGELDCVLSHTPPQRIKPADLLYTLLATRVACSAPLARYQPSPFGLLFFNLCETIEIRKGKKTRYSPARRKDWSVPTLIHRRVESDQPLRNCWSPVVWLFREVFRSLAVHGTGSFSLGNMVR